MSKAIDPERRVPRRDLSEKVLDRRDVSSPVVAEDDERCLLRDLHLRLRSTRQRRATAVLSGAARSIKEPGNRGLYNSIVAESQQGYTLPLTAQSRVTGMERAFERGPL